VDLSEYSFAALREMRSAVIGDPANANPAHAAGRDIHLYTKSARKKLDALAWAVTYRLKAQRASLAHE
jgi:hypothetical protein